MFRFKSIIYIIPIIILAFLALQGCVKTGYGTNSYKAYERTDESGQLEKLFLLPNNNMILIKSLPELEILEAGLYKIYGTKGTHFFGGLWNVSGTGSLLGLRWLTDAQSAWRMSLKFKSKFGVGVSDTSFPNKGEEFETTFIFYKNDIKIGSHHYHKIPVNEDAILDFLTALEKADQNNK